jgi:hypothetical protein
MLVISKAGAREAVPANHFGMPIPGVGANNTTCSAYNENSYEIHLGFTPCY